VTIRGGFSLARAPRTPGPLPPIVHRPVLERPIHAEQTIACSTTVPPPLTRSTCMADAPAPFGSVTQLLPWGAKRRWE
jgi:hypothetical protein